MPHVLTPFERKEIQELLTLKKRALNQSEIFLYRVEGHPHCHSLEADIELSSQEIEELEDLLVHSGS